MKRRLALLAVVLAVLALIVWRWRSGGDDARAPATAAKPTAGASTPTTIAAPRPDPAKLARAAIAGTVTDADTKAPVAGARVCAALYATQLADDVLRERACTRSAADGSYELAQLLPFAVTVSAGAPRYRPTLHHVGGDRRNATLVLAPGQRLTGVDIALRPGGVEVTGVVADLTGGPIARAQVWSGDGAGLVTDTDDQGAFTLWVAPDYKRIFATADGYAEHDEMVNAPGRVEILLTPESSLAGTVVDAATGVAVEGARVMLRDSDDSTAAFSDAEGAFRIAKLSPGRHVVLATTERGYGRTEGSMLVGLGQHVDGVVVKLYPAARVEATIVNAATKAPCVDGRGALRDTVTDRELRLRREPDGRLWLDGVLPGTYAAQVSCRGLVDRTPYPPLVIGDTAVTGIVWEMDPGAVIRGRVLAKAGTPIEDAQVWTRSVGNAARMPGAWAEDFSARDGAYELPGLRAGTYKIEVFGDAHVPPRDGFTVQVTANAVVERDLVLDDGGTIRGTVVDADGKPVADLEVNARLVGGGRGWGEGQTDAMGQFTINGLRAGEYRVTAQRGWSELLRKPGSTDDAKQGERVAVRANQVSTTRIVVEAANGAITGSVVDAAGATVTDAFVSAVRESDAAGAKQTSVERTRWSWDQRPVITATDGTFTVPKLAPGNYTVRAFRRGGGEAIAEHVPVGGTARLQIKATGSLAGTVRRDGAPLDELDITLRDDKTGFHRSETFYRTDGRFTFDDLPAGTFLLTAEGPDARAQQPVTLAEGEAKRGLVIELASLVTLRGRVVEHGTGKPVAGIRMSAAPISGSSRTAWALDDSQRNVSDDRGTFTILRAPRGKLTVRGVPRDWTDSDYARILAIRTVGDGAEHDLGDLPILKKRVKPNDPVGELGINFAQYTADVPLDERAYKAAFVEPDGPAAKAGVVAGDVIVTIDGMPVTGANYGDGGTLLRAVPGTKLVLGLERGTTVTVTLAAP